MVEGQPEAAGEVVLHLPHLRAIRGDGLVRLGRGQFGRCAMLVGGTQEKHLVAPGAHVAGVKIGGQLAAHKVAEMLDPINIRDRGSDEMSSHAARFSVLTCARV